jgi:hypothetical protein
VVRARQSLSLRFLNLCALPSAWTIIKMIHDKRALAKLNRVAGRDNWGESEYFDLASSYSC